MVLCGREVVLVGLVLFVGRDVVVVFPLLALVEGREDVEVGRDVVVVGRVVVEVALAGLVVVVVVVEDGRVVVEEDVPLLIVEGRFWVPTALDAFSVVVVVTV